MAPPFHGGALLGLWLLGTGAYALVLVSWLVSARLLPTRAGGPRRRALAAAAFVLVWSAMWPIHLGLMSLQLLWTYLREQWPDRGGG